MLALLEVILLRIQQLLLFDDFLFFVLELGVLISDFALIYSEFDFWDFDEVFDGWTFSWVDVEALFYDSFKVLRITFRYAFDLAFYDLFSQSQVVFGCKGRQQADQLVDDTAQTPYVRLLIVLLLVHLLRTHVVRRSNIGLSHQAFVVVLSVCLYYSRETKVAQFDVVVGVKEDVARFEVSMKNFASLDSAHMALP